MSVMAKSGFDREIGHDNICASIDAALRALPLTGAVHRYRLEMTGQMERSHAHGHKPMLPGIDCQYENVKREDIG